MVAFIETNRIHLHRDNLRNSQAQQFLRDELGVEKDPQGNGFTTNDSWTFFGMSNLGRVDYDEQDIPEITNYRALYLKVATSSRSIVTAVKTTYNTSTRRRTSEARRISFDDSPTDLGAIAPITASKFIAFHSVDEFFPTNIPGGCVWESRTEIDKSISRFKGTTERTTEDWCVDWAIRLRDDDLAAVLIDKHLVVLWYYLKFLFRGMADEHRPDFSPEKVNEIIGAHKLQGTFRLCLPMERAKVRYKVPPANPLFCAQVRCTLVHGRPCETEEALVS
jgi:hypothetical protein